MNPERRIQIMTALRRAHRAVTTREVTDMANEIGPERLTPTQVRPQLIRLASEGFVVQSVDHWWARSPGTSERCEVCIHSYRPPSHRMLMCTNVYSRKNHLVVNVDDWCKGWQS